MESHGWSWFNDILWLPTATTDIQEGCATVVVRGT